MRLTTILTLPGADLAEKWDRLKEWAAQKVAWGIPRRAAYWAFIRIATSNTDGYPGDLTVAEVLDREEGVEEASL